MMRPLKCTKKKRLKSLSGRGTCFLQAYLENSEIMADMEEGCDASSLPVRLVDFCESEVPFSRLKASYVGGCLPTRTLMRVWAQSRSVESNITISI